MKTIPLTQGRVAIVDDEDYAKLSQHRWYHQSFGRRSYAYRRIGRGVNAPHEFMHRMVVGLKRHDGKSVDHRNGDGLDNRRQNLRVATNAENARNSALSANNTSGYKRVCWHKAARKWFACIMVDRVQISLGLYDDPVDAALAYDLAALKYHGEFARPNFLRVTP